MVLERCCAITAKRPTARLSVSFMLTGEVRSSRNPVPPASMHCATGDGSRPRVRSGGPVTNAQCGDGSQRNRLVCYVTFTPSPQDALKNYRSTREEAKLYIRGVRGHAWSRCGLIAFSSSWRLSTPTSVSTGSPATNRSNVGILFTA